MFPLFLKKQEMTSLHQQSRKSISSQQSQSMVVRQASETFLHDWDKFKLRNKSCLPVQGNKFSSPPRGGPYLASHERIMSDFGS